MATKIQLRRDTAADWTSANPTLAAGEFGYESDTTKFKIGDGSTAWNSLAYKTGEGFKVVGDDSATITVAEEGTLYVQGGTNVTTSTDSAGVLTINATAGSGTITALNNQAENRLVSIGATTTELDGEANLTFDGTTLGVTGKQTITNTTTDDSLLITTTEDSSTAAPVITLKRNSGSPADGDYLGQIKFKGENDADQEVVYAKITGKTSDVTDTTEDGLIEFALQKAGSNNIGARLTSTDFKTLNGTGITSNGNISSDGSITATTTIGNDAVTIDDNVISTSRSNDTLGIGANGSGVINLSTTDNFLTSEMTQTGTAYGSDSINNLKGVSLLYKEDSIGEITAAADRRYSHALLSEWKLNTGINTSNSNMRFRNYIGAAAMDMNGSSSTNTSLSRGPRAADFQTQVLNSNATAATLGSAVAGASGIYLTSSDSAGDLTITNAAGVNTFLEVEKPSGLTSTITNGYGNYYSSSVSGSGSGGITNEYGFYVASMNGTNKYAFYDNTNSVSVFGDIQTQAVSITDNLITTNRSNDDLTLGTNGTGRIKLSTDGSDFFSNTLYETYFGGTSNIKTLAISSQETVNAQTAARNYEVGISQNTTLSASGTSNGNFRQRSMNLANSMDMAGFSFTQASEGRGPMAGNFATNVVNSDTTASTLYTASGLNVAMAAYDEGSFSDGDVTVTEAIGTQSFIELYSGGTGSGNYTFTNAYNYKTKASVGANDTVTNLYGYYYRTPSGSGTITNEYAFYDASNGLSVFGDIQTQGVSITDNHIKSNRSNDSLNFETNGTGRFNFGDSQTFNIDWQSLYGADNRVTDLAFIKEESKDANTSGFEYMAGFHHDVQLTGSSSTNSSFRPRGLLSLMTLDHAGYSYTRSGLFRGPLGAAFGALSMNSSSTAATLANNRGLEISHGAYSFQGATAQGDVTITDSTGCMAISYSANDDTGTTADFNITNAYGFRSGFYVIGASSSMTNHYGYYYAGDEYGGGTQPTNIYAFYDNANKLSRFGAVILANQSGDPSTVADSAHIYAKDVSTSSEVFVRDEAGNVTQISPHNEAGEWQYWSENIKTGKKVRVNMERMIRKLEEITGETFIENE